MSNPINSNQFADEMEILLEAARRANWDALRGPMHLRSGRFWVLPPPPWLSMAPTSTMVAASTTDVTDANKKEPT